MTHFICKGRCNGSSEMPGVCETEGCPKQWELLEECDCAEGKHFREAAEEVLIVKDSNGTVLKDGDDVVLIKDLTLRGSEDGVFEEDLEAHTLAKLKKNIRLAW